MKQTQKLRGGAALALVVTALLQGPAHGSVTTQGSVAAQCPAAAKWLDTYGKRMHDEVKIYARAKPKDPTLAGELAQRAERDQKARHAVMDASAKPGKTDFKHLHKIDQSNLAWIKPLVDASGFPSVADVGAQGVQNAWLLTQHADSDPAFQAKVLSQLKQRLKSENFMRADYAMLIDRVRLAQNKKQIYGSQLAPKDDGQWVLRPVEDRAHLDQRRATMDLMPMADYMCWMHTLYGATPKKP
jgi:hypothetical protein